MSSESAKVELLNKKVMANTSRSLTLSIWSNFALNEVLICSDPYLSDPPGTANRENTLSSSAPLMPASPRKHSISAISVPMLPRKIGEEQLQKKSSTMSFRDSWIITLLGDGGVGKTALAIQVRDCSANQLHLLITDLQFLTDCFTGKSDSISTHEPVN